ncbi:MAG: FHA domain-containing protein, partial [Acidobacteriota bacterium]|nr:FHA domain-containing protein [Acidobacteriota bacterium]
MSWRLIAEGGRPVLEIVPGRKIVVGRSPACDAPLRDPTISRQHAELQGTGSGLEVRDLGSTNGTFVNGTRIHQAVATAGMQVAFGKMTFDLRREPDTTSRAAVAPPPFDPLDATILRQVAVRGSADIAAQLSDHPDGA